MFTASFECTYGSYIRMEYQKTFHAMIATPVNIEDVIMGEIIYGATRSLIAATGVLVVIGSFGLITSPWAVLCPVVAVFAGVMFAGIAIIVTSLVPSINEFNYYFTLFISPMFLFSGVFFPIEGLHPFLQKLAWLSPLTHTVSLERALVLGDIKPLLIYNGLFIIVSAFILCNIAIVLLRKRLIK